LRRTGFADLPLHYGKAPKWLVTRMQRLAGEIVAIIVDDFGPNAFVERISDPFWFQALGCVLGYDWHSSGVTTVITGILKSALSPEKHGISVCGGKGKASRNTVSEIEVSGDKFDFSQAKIRELQYASRMTAKVDTAAIQAGYQLYHHAFFTTEGGQWAVVQQGMSHEDRTARRYHWLSSSSTSFVVEPHTAIVGEVRRRATLDMTSKDSEGCRRTSVDIVREPVSKNRCMMMFGRVGQKSLQEWMTKTTEVPRTSREVSFLYMPGSINWKTLQKVYEFQPSNYEELLGFKGVGPATVRGLALIADLIYGQRPSWKDPVKYSFAYGGKDGVPYPADRKAMDESIQILSSAVEEAKIGKQEKMHSLRGLRRAGVPYEKPCVDWNPRD